MLELKEALMIDSLWSVWLLTGLCYIIIFVVVSTVFSDYKHGHVLVLGLNLSILIGGNLLGLHF